MKHTEITETRNRLLKENPICPLCHEIIEPDEAALDHCHDTGHVRRVLHRSCNHAEGVVKKAIRRSRSRSPEEFLANLLCYWDTDFSANPIHPMFKKHCIARFARLNKSEMNERLRSFGVQTRRSESKKDLVQRYRDTYGINHHTD